jgi:hypothetical protein
MGKNVTDPLAEIAGRILIVRGQRVLLDADLAQLYGVSTKAFNQAVRRNRGRFPGDFLIDLTNQEVASLRSQFVTLKTGRGEHRKYRQLAFTEHGAIMAATILNSPRPEYMSVYVRPEATGGGARPASSGEHSSMSRLGSSTPR